MTKGSIEDLTASSIDFELLVNTLSASPRATRPEDADPLIRAKLRGIVRRKQILAQLGGALSAEGLCRVDRHKPTGGRLASQPKSAHRSHSGQAWLCAYPAFQFEEGKSLAGLKEVLHALRDHDPWMQSIFFANSTERLSGKTPLEALRQGDRESVIRAAESYGEQGAE